jgi:hypothetical protein
VPNRVQAHGKTFELGDKHFHVLARPVLLGGDLVDGRNDGRSVGALVLCVLDAENSRRVVRDTLNKQKGASTKRRLHDVSSTGLTTPGGWLVVFFIGLVVVIIASNY